MLGVGIVGCGNISEAYLKLAPLFRDFEIRAVADLDASRAERRAGQFGVRAETVEGLLRARDVDAVVNLTVPAAHHAVTRAILEAGKHAYSEKPFVLSVEEGERLRELAAAKGLRVGSAPDTFLGGAHQRARALVDEGALGRVLGGSAHVMGHGMEGWHPDPDFFFRPGGGPVLDMGPYYVTWLVNVLGPVRSVAATAKAGFPTRTIGVGPREGEVLEVSTATDVQAILEFASGATVAFGASWDVWAHRHPNLELYGETASLYVPDPNFFGGPVTLARDEEEASGWDHPFGVDNHAMHDGTPVANWRGAGLADMARAIAEGRPHRCSLDLALHVVDVLLSVLRAGEERAWVEVGTTCARPAALGPEEARGLLR